MADRSEYLAFLVKGYEREVGRLDEEIAAWEQQFSNDDPLLGYRAPKWPLQMACVAAYLYSQNGRVEFAYQARDTLLRYREFVQRYPRSAAESRPEYSQGVPPLDAVFDPIIFGPACERIMPILSVEERNTLAEIAADSLRLIWRFPEWGGHNRAMLRAASLAVCAHAFNDHPEAAAWIELADELAEESWGRWSIEDTMMYPAHWLRALIVYAEARGRLDEFTQFIQPRMHLKSIVQMLSPLGILPDFGDSHWLMHSHWEWMSLLEWGAAIYQDASMKWAAGRIWQVQQKETPSIYASQALMMCHSWSSDSTKEALPGNILDALDDLVVKKLVFRTGWEANSSYACVNYRDEGDYGRVVREYLRTNLAVSAEKMHHGHADEGSFAMLVHDGTLLLHESGYRESPPDGIYRADLYHNRVVWRQGIRLSGSTAWNSLNDNGHYKPVRTDRLYQTSLLGIDIRRIRVTDETQGLSWDRSIFFLPKPTCWVVVDTIMATRTAPHTFGLLWWTSDVLEQEGNWLKTHLSGIQTWKNANRSALWIGIPKIHGQQTELHVETARRSFQNETMIADLWSGDARAGRSLNYVSLLVPRSVDDPLQVDEMAVQVFPSEPDGRGLAVSLTLQGEVITMVTLNDLTASFLQEDIRPRYNFEQGSYRIGAISSDAAFSILRSNSNGIQAGMINGTRLEVNDRLVYQMPFNAMFQEDRSFRQGITARFRWQGQVE